jgi:hypothetical protein
LHENISRELYKNTNKVKINFGKSRINTKEGLFNFVDTSQDIDPWNK